MSLVCQQQDTMCAGVIPSPDTVGEFGTAIQSGLENPDYRSVRILLLPIDGAFQSR